MANKISWKDRVGPGPRQVSSEDGSESPEPQKLSTPDGFQKSKEDLSSSASSISLSQVPDFQYESQPLSELHMAEMEKVFKDEVNSTRALDMEAFIKAMRRKLSSVSEEMLKMLFMKVDVNCTGFITWSNYVDYMMREFQGKDLMRKSQYHVRFHLPMRIVPLNHGCEVVKVEFLIQRSKKIGHFLTVTKDGVLQFWSESFSPLSSFKLNHIRPLHSQQMWVIDMVCLHNMNLVAVATTDQKIEFFDISNHKCGRAFTFVDLDSCVLVMDYWSDHHRAVFCFGDTKGSVTVFTSENVASGLFNPRILPRTSKWDHWTSVSMKRLLNEKSPLYRSYQLKALHHNWCQQVRFIPNMNLVASCSAIEKSSLVLAVLPSKASKNPRFSALNLRKGILCFDYCPDRNFLVTGGYDPLIRLWNPFFSKKPVWLMKGHQTSVTHILVNGKNSSILLSISKDKTQICTCGSPRDRFLTALAVGSWLELSPAGTPVTSLLYNCWFKNIRVWDLQEYICLQSFCGKLFALGNCPVTSACFLEKDNTLICSTFSIGILKGYMETQGPGKHEEKTTTHSSALCAVLYSKIFKQVVSGCLSGGVCVWEIVTGKMMTEFSVTSEQRVELTSMCLDESERCLLTGLRDGTVKMWNYSNGESLLTFPNPDKLEISGIAHVNKVFYVTGWSKRITYFSFHETKLVLLCHHWQTFHTEDVLSMAKYQNQFLGTSSYNGDILFWNLNMSKPILKFNAAESPSPLTPKRVQGEKESLVDSHRPSKPCEEPQKWACKIPMPRQFLDRSTKTVANSNLRRNLVSAPPVMRQHRDKLPDGLVPLQRQLSPGRLKVLQTYYGKQSHTQEAERTKAELKKKVLLQSKTSVEKIIFLQTRPRLPYTAALLSSCVDGYIYAWSIHGNGGLLGKFPVDITDNEDVVVGAMATDKNDYILLTGDSNGYIKIWDIKDYCTVSIRRSTQPSRTNKFQFLIPQPIQINHPSYTPLEEKEVVAGQTISLVPPKLLISWKGHVDGVADILYVDSFQLVVSAGQDWDVKAWKLSGDTIGTFGLSVWKKLQDAQMVADRKTKTLKKDDSIAVPKVHSELQEARDFAEALVYQRREQVALLALLNGKADREAEAWAKLQTVTLASPWAGARSPEDIENSWCKWESEDKQVSKVLGAAYKPRERPRSPGLSVTMPYDYMKHQISPQIYQSLYVNELAPTQHPDFRMPKGQLVCPVTQDSQKDPHPGREPDSTPAALSSSSFLPCSPASGSSGFLDGRSTSLGLQSPLFPQRS